MRKVGHMEADLLIPPEWTESIVPRSQEYQRLVCRNACTAGGEVQLPSLPSLQILLDLEIPYVSDDTNVLPTGAVVNSGGASWPEGPQASLAATYMGGERWTTCKGMNYEPITKQREYDVAKQWPEDAKDNIK